MFLAAPLLRSLRHTSRQHRRPDATIRRARAAAQVQPIDGHIEDAGQRGERCDGDPARRILLDLPSMPARQSGESRQFARPEAG